MTGFVINVDHWSDSKFVTVSGFGKHMRPDTHFCQYTVGKLKPNYPMPAIQGSVFITKYAVYLADPKGYDCLACWRFNRGQVI